MSETQFAMVSDWMVNGNINDFVKAHPDANRLELVGIQSSLIFLSSARVYRQSGTCLAGRCHKWVDLHPQPRNDSWGPERGAFVTAGATFPSYRA